MTKERWRLLEEMFHAALERPEAERRQFVQQSCGDDTELREEVERLLRNDQQASSDDLGNSVVAQRVRRAASLVSVPPRQGDRVGHYLIAEEIGHGGMGLVYRATRADQEFEKQVAIKVAKSGMDTAVVLERFRRERQILANLDHRYIAKLLDGGTTHDGLPYFVMEYVEGQPIHEYARAKNLSLRQRLNLMRDVCQAVAYAHQNLVVHLDLKPGNILIGTDGTPKLLDFGISRLLDPTDTAVTPGTPSNHDAVVASGSGTTALGRLLTPDYASPEQVRGEVLTTATDVYSLGVVMYQLLTGELPHRLEGLTATQMEQVICSFPVTRPSQRAPASSRPLAGDLDSIVMTAMAKDVSQRYRTAQELDEELRRYLEGLPVRARKGSRFYQLRKFVWRNRPAAVAIAGVFLSLFAGLLVARWQARVAEELRHTAESESNRAEMNATQAQSNAAKALANEQQAKLAQHDALEQQRLADERLEELRKLSTTYLFDFNDQLANSPGTLKVRRTMVDSGIKFLDGLSKQAAGNARLRLDMAAAYRRLGDVLGNPNMPNLGDSKAALESYRKGLAMVEAIRKDEVSRDDHLLAQAMLHDGIGEVVTVTGPATGAVAEYAVAVRMAKDLLQRHEGDVRFDNPIAKILTDNSQGLADAGHPELMLARVHENRPILMRLVAHHPDDPEFPDYLASDYSAEGRALGLAGDLRESLAAYQHYVELLEALERKFPPSVARSRMLMMAYSHVGDTLGSPQFRSLGDYAGAAVAYEKMSRLADEAAAADPENTLVHFDAAMSAGRLGGVRLAAGNAAEALPALEKARAGLEKIVAKDPNNKTRIRFLCNQYELLGDAHDALGEFAVAKTYYAKAIATVEPNPPPSDLASSTDFQEGHFKLGLVLAKEGDPAAIDHINLAIAQNQRDREARPDRPVLRARAARSFGGRALADARLAARPGLSPDERALRLREARADLERADQFVAGLPPETPGLAPSRSLAVLSEARRLLAEAK